MTSEKKQSRPRALRARSLVSAENVLALATFVALFYVPYLVVGYPVFILPQYMLFGVLAMTLCLLWGMVGIVSFGQGAFFALGAYALGVTIKNSEAASAPWLALVFALAIGGITAGLIGYFLFSAKVRDAYFVLVTLAIPTIVYVMTNTESDITGGFNGMFVPRVSFPFGAGSLSLEGDLGAYYLIFAFTVVSYVGFRLLQWSRFGRVLVSIRENEERTEALGYNTAVYKTIAFSISGSVAALAGALYATDAGFVSPPLGGVLFSTTVVVWVAVGGRDYFIGAILGAIGLSVLGNELNSRIPEYWQLILGVLFILVVAFFRKGIVGSAVALAGSRGGARS